MRRLLNDEMDKFLRENSKGTRFSELTKMLNEEFGTSYTQSQIKNYTNRHKIKNGLKHVGVKGSKLTNAEIDEFIKENVKGTKTEDLVRLVNKKFGTNYTYDQMKAYKNRKKIKSGIDSRFKKGQIPFNKGLKGWNPNGSVKGWFKKGNTPSNHRPVGSERVDKSGYTLIKIAEPGKWILKHRFIWEQHNGPIKKNHVVIFLDGDKANFDISNLAEVSRNELKILNKNQLIYDNAEATRSGIAIAKLIDTKHKVKKQAGVK